MVVLLFDVIDGKDDDGRQDDGYIVDGYGDCVIFYWFFFCLMMGWS